MSQTDITNDKHEFNDNKLKKKENYDMYSNNWHIEKDIRTRMVRVK